MKYGFLFETFPFLKTIEKERQEQFEEYFRTAPLWLIEAFQVEEMDRHVVFVRENEPADMIYFIGKGIIEAIDYRFCGISYEFMRFDRVYAMGGMEFIMDLERYCTTLRTVTKCTVMKLPRITFERWMRTDSRALKQEAKMVGQYLLEDSRKGRAFLFLQGSDRLAMLVIERYERYARNGVLQLKGGRQNLSNATGLCVKTINRAVKKFSDRGLITREGNKILVDQEQYGKLKELVASAMESK
nr:Crp/Fnr family transcriptional regulator [uncultured Mediterraneibacter sp.]